MTKNNSHADKLKMGNKEKGKGKQDGSKKTGENVPRCGKCKEKLDMFENYPADSLRICRKCKAKMKKGEGSGSGGGGSTSRRTYGRGAGTMMGRTHG